MNSPYFLWDYNLTEDQIHAILQGENKVDRLWLIGRILTHAKFEDVWKYLTLTDLVRVFPTLRLPKKTKQAWHRALTTWGYHV